MSQHDVYAYGVVSASTLIRIAGTLPKADGYAELVGEQHMTGGEATNSAIVLSRLGVDVKLDGNWLGDDEAGRRTESLLQGFGIDTAGLSFRDDFSSVREVVVAAEATRTIFGTYDEMHNREAWNLPDEKAIASARVLCLDPFFADASLSAADMAAKHGVPAVTVDCLHDDPIASRVSALVISEAYLEEHYADEDLEKVFSQYQANCPGLLVFTFGAVGCWFARPGDEVSRMPAFKVEATDTAGAGDSFRAAVVYGVLQGWPDKRLLEFASAVAAMVCTRSPGVINAPTLDEVIEFIGRPAQ